MEEAAFRDPPPALDGERCIHARSIAASCTACIDICPRDAWTVDGQGLRIDAGRCDGCGLCAGVCPEAALNAHARPFLGDHDGRKAAFACCTRECDADAAARLPCLHALGLRDLARLWAQGVRVLVVREASCRSCGRVPAPPDRLSRTVERFRHLMSSRDASPLRLEVLSAPRFRRALRRSRAVEPARRALLRRLAAAGAPESTSRDAAIPLPSGGADALWPHVPWIDPERCDGCDACVRGCPHGALELRRDEEGRAIDYHVRPERCSGCGLCVDLCEAAAIEIRSDSPTAQPVPLRRQRCRSCRTVYHEPTRRPGHDRCRICRVVDHGRRLFLVLDRA